GTRMIGRHCEVLRNSDTKLGACETYMEFNTGVARQARTRTTFVGLALATLTLAGVAGCGVRPSSPLPPARPFAGAVVRVACPGDPSAEVVARYGKAWASQAGVSLEIVRYDPATGPEVGPTADAWIIRPPQLARWASTGKLQPLPREYTASESPSGWDKLL